MEIGWVQKAKDVVMPWRRRMKKSSTLGIRNMVPLAIRWATWKARNLGQNHVHLRFQALHFGNLYALVRNFLTQSYSPLTSTNTNWPGFVHLLEQVAGSIEDCHDTLL